MKDRSLEQPPPLFAALGIEPSNKPRFIPPDLDKPGAGERTRCKSCGAEIVWGTTEAGKNMPFDVECEKGLYVIDHSGVAHAVPVRKSHFATCPHADQHRKPTS